MIPVRLTLHNFMPYREGLPPLDFTGIHTAAIWGDNGNGKSAIIDAITWALWGETRAKTDDDIIYLGAQETRVEFDFLVGEQLYRVIRRHARPKRSRGSGPSQLDFYIEENGDFKTISGDGIRDTSQKIIDTLHMDYDTFVNSAFLRQGHADEFTQQPPAKRKEVLGNILGLSVYDSYEEIARERARQLELEKALVERDIQGDLEELEKKPACEAELKEVEEELERVDAAFTEQESRLLELRRRNELLESKRSQLAQLEKHLAATTRSLQMWQGQLEQRRAKVRSYEELVARREEIETEYSRLVEAKKTNEELDRKFRTLSGLKERHLKLDAAVNRAGEEVRKDHALLEREIGRLEEVTGRIPGLKDELRKTLGELKLLGEDEKVITGKKEAEQQLRKTVHGLEIEIERLGREIAGIDEKLGMLGTESGAVCPVCGTELGEQGLKHIESEYAAGKESMSGEIVANRTALAAQTAEMKTLVAEIAGLESKLAETRTALRSHAGVLNRQIEEAGKENERLEEARKSIHELEQRLVSKDYALAEQETMRRLEEEIALLDYDPQRHEDVGKLVLSLALHEEPKRKLDEAEKQIAAEREAVTEGEKAIAEMQESIASDRAAVGKLEEEIAALPELAEALAGAEEEFRKVSAEQKRLQESVSTLRWQLRRFAGLEDRVKELRQSVSKASEEESIYRELALAFGKKGVQGWLIEMALPEIESEANDLLGRMTDHRMHVAIEPLRQTRKGDTVETLDIKIADELGTRNYEMYSGGEAFRINFAIRIALSKVLARRHGAPLPTLIIDEGFGTQDVNGLEKLKEAITSIQDDFKMILVITHIEELRDSFPTRIGVTKSPDGSMIEVS